MPTLSGLYPSRIYSFGGQQTSGPDKLQQTVRTISGVSTPGSHHHTIACCPLAAHRDLWANAATSSVAEALWVPEAVDQLQEKENCMEVLWVFKFDNSAWTWRSLWNNIEIRFLQSFCQVIKISHYSWTMFIRKPSVTTTTTCTTQPRALKASGVDWST